MSVSAIKPSKIGLFSLLLSLTFLFTNISHGETSRELAAGEELVTLAVENMTWVGCVVAVRNSLRALQGVNEVDVDLDDETAVVIYQSAILVPAKMIEATSDIGFPSSVKEQAK